MCTNAAQWSFMFISLDWTWVSDGLVIFTSFLLYFSVCFRTHRLSTFQCCGVAQWFCNNQRAGPSTLHFDTHTGSFNEMISTNHWSLLPLTLAPSWMLAGRQRRGGFQQGRKLKPWEVSQPAWRSCCRREPGACCKVQMCKCAIQAL